MLIVAASGVAIFLTFTYLIFASTSSAIFRTFQCRTYGDDETRYLVADKTIDCDSDLHKFWEKYALLMIGVYPFGIPFLYAILLYRKKSILLDGEARTEDEGVQGISFLWKMYEPHCWWFEVFECIRRLSLTGLIIFVYPDTPTQTVIAMILAIISIKVGLQRETL